MAITLQNNSYTLTANLGGVFDSANPSGTQNSYLRFTTTRFIATGTGNVALTVERYGGTSGTISAEITQVAANRSTGKYTPVTIPVSFADGEIGTKIYNFNITTAPSDGPYWINLVLNTSAFAVRHWWDNNSEIEVNDGSSVPVSDVTNVYEVGPSGDWTTLVDMCRNVQSPALVYVRGATYANEDYQSDGEGINPFYSGDRGDRIIVMSYPAETVNIVPDSSATDMLTQVPNNQAFQFRLARLQGALPAKGWVFKGLNIYQGTVGVHLPPTDGKGYHEHIIVEDCEVYNIGGGAGGNPAGVMHKDTRYSAVRNCIMHDIYEDNSLHIGTHDNNVCVHGYKQADIAIEDNTFYNAAHLIYHKNPPETLDGETGHVIRRNDLGICTAAIRMEDHYIGKATPFSFISVDIYHNICRTAQFIDSVVDRTFYSSQGLWVYGNTAANGIGGLWGSVDAEIYNNISVKTSGSAFTFQRFDDWIAVADNPYDPADSATWPTPGDPDSTDVHEAGTIKYMDYNTYDPSFVGDLALGSATNAQNITTLAAWRLATDSIQMPIAIAGQNSVLFDPVLDANFRPTVTVPNGRFGQVVGVPDSVVVGGTL